jgi:hypothetical protein
MVRFSAHLTGVPDLITKSLYMFLTWKKLARQPPEGGRPDLLMFNICQGKIKVIHATTLLPQASIYLYIRHLPFQIGSRSPTFFKSYNISSFVSLYKKVLTYMISHSKYQYIVPSSDIYIIIYQTGAIYFCGQT